MSMPQVDVGDRTFRGIFLMGIPFCCIYLVLRLLVIGFLGGEKLLEMIFKSVVYFCE